MNKFFRLMIVGLIFCIVFITGCSKDISTEPINIKALRFEDIKSARIELASAGMLAGEICIFDFNNSNHTKVIEDVIRYLSSGKVQGNADEKVIRKGGSPTFLILELKDGSFIQIKSAVGGKVIKLSDGSSEIAQFDIPNEVTIRTNSNEKPIRILSPEIKKLIVSEYKDIFK